MSREKPITRDVRVKNTYRSWVGLSIHPVNVSPQLQSLTIARSTDGREGDAAELRISSRPQRLA